jgi:hypothetical protein
MINEDVIIKIVRNNGHKTDWPELVQQFFIRLDEIKLGFPGIRNSDLSYVNYTTIGVDDIFIYDDFRTPVMYKKLDDNNFEVVGIGCGSYEAPGEKLFRWKDIIQRNFNDSYVYRVDCRPTENGGHGYYYFYRAYRDYRK